MDLELHQLDLRYAALRKRNPRQERVLVSSLAEVGQLFPIVVVDGRGGSPVVLDGYKRVRGLRRLSRDTVRATVWEMEESEALLLERLMRTTERDGPLEQGWLLRELRERFSLTQEEIARRFDKSISWVSRRLSLVGELPGEIHDHVRAGEITAHAAMKHLVPLARANVEDCVKLAQVFAAQRLSSREVERVCAGWMSGSPPTRALLLTDPRVFLRAQVEAERSAAAERSQAELLMDELGALGGMARRTHRRLQQGVLRGLAGDARAEVRQRVTQARGDAEMLFNRFDKEDAHAGPPSTGGDPGAAQTGPRQ
jgi:ParB/RepB/Spo0J family partition protein